MAINDEKIAWNRRRVFFPCRTMFGVLDDSTSGVPASLGSGVPVFAEISANFELAALQLRDEDEIYHFFPIPWDMDLGYPIRFRLWFIHTATDADTPDFQITYKGVGKQAALSDAKDTPDETLTILDHACSTTGNSLEVTAWTESTSQNHLVSTDFGVIFAVEITDLGGASNDEIMLLGVEVDYTMGAAPGEFRRTTLKAVASPTGPNY